MSLEKRFAIRTATPATTTWVALTCPGKYDYVEIVNQTSVDIYLRTDSANAASQILIPVNQSYSLTVPILDYTYRGTRFIAGDIVGYAQLSSSGSGNVVVTYLL